MSDDDLLAGIVGATLTRDALEEAEEARARAVERAERAPEPPAAPDPNAADDGLEIATEHIPYAADPRHNIMGLTRGRPFTFVDAGADLDGLWIVAKVDASGPDASARYVVGSRDGQSPPFVKITEDVLREELALGRLKLD